MFHLFVCVIPFLQGFPEFEEDEIVSVPDAKYTKGEFEVYCYTVHFN